MDKEDVVHLYNRILLSHQKESNNAICSNMDGPRDYHTKQSKSERERQIPYDITYMWNLKYDINQHIYETKTDSQIQRTDLWLPRDGGWGQRGGKDWEFGISRCKLVYIGWINKVLLYSAGNYIQYPVTNHDGKEYEKEYIYVWVYMYIYV